MTQLVKLACLFGLAVMVGCPHDNSETIKPAATAGVAYSSMAATKSDGTLWQWGSVCPTATSTPVQLKGDQQWAMVAVGSAHYLAINTDGSLWGWGDNSCGELGNGTYDLGCSPTRMNGDSDWISVSAGDGFTLAVKRDGSLWAWGNNQGGRLGLGYASEVDKGPNTPQRVGDARDWKQVFSGTQPMAIKKNGTLWTWGTGYLGNGSRDPSNIPTQVGPDANWASVSSSSTHVVAIKSDGTLWGFGDQSLGELATGQSGANTPQVLSPIPIGADSKWLAAAAGFMYTAAIKQDGTLWVSGQLYCAGFEATAAFSQISSDHDWTAVAAGNNAVIATKKDGSLWTWGCNSQGELGTGDSQSKKVPTPVAF